MQLCRKEIDILKNRNKAAFFFLAPSVIGVMVFVVVPFLDVFRRSFLNAMGTKWKGLSNYTKVIHNDAFLLAVKNTVLFCLCCIPILLLVSLLFSVLIMGMKHLQNICKTLFLLPMAVPVASVVVLWKMLFYDNGIINHLLAHFSINTVSWMDSGASFWMLVISYIWKNIGYFMVLWIAGLSMISNDIYEAAALDGAGSFKKFRFITLPNLTGTIVMNIILAFVNSFKVFREAYLVAGNYPDEHIYLLQHLFNNWFSQLDMEKMSSAAVLVTLVMSAFIIIVLELEHRKEVKMG